MSKTNIKMFQPHYIVKREDGVIVCKIKTYGTLPQQLQALYDPKVYAIKEFTAVARHHKSDVWNETVGKRIAESKCKRKIYKYYANLFNNLLEAYKRNSIDVLEQKINNLNICFKHETEHLYNLMG